MRSGTLVNNVSLMKSPREKGGEVSFVSKIDHTPTDLILHWPQIAPGASLDARARTMKAPLALVCEKRWKNLVRCVFFAMFRD